MYCDNKEHCPRRQEFAHAKFVCSQETLHEFINVPVHITDYWHTEHLGLLITIENEPGFFFFFFFARPVAHEFIYIFTYANECFYHTMHIANVLPLVLYVTAKLNYYGTQI